MVHGDAFVKEHSIFQNYLDTYVYLLIELYKQFFYGYIFFLIFH